MGSGEVAGIPGLTPRMAAAAMTMAIARREPNYYIAGFANGSDPSHRDGFRIALHEGRGHHGPTVHHGDR